MVDVDGPEPELCEVVRQTLIAEGVSSGRVDMHFVTIDEIATLNSEHLGGSGPTDVLSFPIDGLDYQDSGPGGHHIGEIVICIDVAQAQADHHMGDLQSELKLLSIHAALHLCGFDHHEPVDRAEMWAREAVHLGRYQLTHPGDQQ